MNQAVTSSPNDISRQWRIDDPVIQRCVTEIVYGEFSAIYRLPTETINKRKERKSAMEKAAMELPSDSFQIQNGVVRITINFAFIVFPIPIKLTSI